MLPPEQLAHRIVGFLQERAPQAVSGLGEELGLHVQMLLRETLGKMDLITREEFAVQEKVLARTRSRLEALERQVALMEASLAARDSTGRSGPQAGD
jgi:BMFP domain-containing protein YqiC